MLSLCKLTVCSAQGLKYMGMGGVKAAAALVEYERRALASYVRPEVVRMISGARYAGVPTLEPGAD